jgi:hypothetical protein
MEAGHLDGSQPKSRGVVGGRDRRRRGSGWCHQGEVEDVDVG